MFVLAMPPSPRDSIFISYARSDGTDYAARLRDRLEKEHPEIKLFQDVISLHSGKDWWLQITNALDQVACMVLVATPDAMASDAVRKEWRYARQKGVCVLPVRASDLLNFDSLPRWMTTLQFADLKVGHQWELFIGDLRRPCESPRVPFMAEDLPLDHVARPAEFEPLIHLLLDREREQRKPVAITTALRGAGGFGKTTLARAVCHDERILEVFDDGVLWVTLGEKVDNLVGKVAELTTMLSGEPTTFTSKEAAGTKLRELLADRDILMVIDDVWDAAHLEPFLQGGHYCARLITTRNLDTVPAQCREVKVDSMQPGEAAELLGSGLPQECKPQIMALAKRAGNWPLVLGIVNGVLRERVDRMHQPFAEAIAYANKALDKRGLTAFDPRNTEARNRAVELTVDLSLEPIARTERERFEELSIFSADVDVPLKTVERLWQATAGLDEFDAEELCVQLHNRSLLQVLDLEARYLRLHDVMRSYLQAALARRTDPKRVNGRLVDGWGDPHKLPDAFAWQWYAFHMAAADRATELRELLLSPAWLRAKLIATDIASLTADFVRLPMDEEVELVHGAIRLSAHVLSRDPDQFASQMVGRLLPHQGMAAIRQFAERTAQGTSKPWLRPLQATLHPPGTSLIRTLQGHSGSVYSVALTGDGRRAVSASDDEALKVWDVETGRELRTLQGHTDSVNGVALSGDGRQAISASSDYTLRVWDAETGRRLRTLQGHTGSVNGVALSKDGRRAVSASSDRTLKVWDVETGHELRTLQGHTGSVNGVALDGDGRRVVSASRDHTLKVWNVQTGHELRTFQGHTGSVNGVVLSKDGRRAVSASGDKTLKMWDVETGHELRTFQGHAGPVTGVVLSEDGRRAVSASDDHTLKVWDVETGHELHSLRGHAGPVTGVVLSEDGRRAVSASDDNTLKVWDVEKGGELRILQGHTGVVLGVAFSGDRQCAVSASSDRTLKVWDLKTGDELRSFHRHTQAVNCVALSGNGRRAVSASSDYTLQVWDTETGRRLRTLRGHTRAVTWVVLGWDGRSAVSASLDHTLKVWDVETGYELRTLHGHTGSVNGVALNADGRRAVSASSDHTLKVWDVEAGYEIRTLQGHTGSVLGVALSGDGRRVVSASRDHTLKVWDVQTGHELRTFQGHTQAVTGVALSEDSSRALSASRDHRLKIWDVQTGEAIATFTCDGPAYCCAFISDRVLAGDAGGGVHFLRLEEPRSWK